MGMVAYKYLLCTL